jgi:hypothetical protein
MYPIYSAWVLDATTLLPNASLVGKQVQVVTRNTTTPYPIYNAASDPIPSSLMTVTPAGTTPTVYIDTETPGSVYLDWYDAASGSRGPINFEEVSRQASVAAQAAAEAALAELQAYILANPGGGGVTDHSLLSNLTTGDPHTQYDTPARSLARHYSKEETGTLVANAVAAASAANRARENHTGTQGIETITNLESRLAALEAGGGGGSGILLIPEGTEPPLGTSPGLIGYIPSGVDPEPPTVETVSYDSEGTSVSCAVPAGVAIGDAVIFIPGFDPAATAGDISVSDSGWTEIIDYSANHTRDTGAYVYRVTDSTALSALGATVTANYGQTARRMGICFVVPGSLVASAWPAYTSGSNRSAATINSNTTTGCSIQGFSTATVPFHKVALFVMHDAASDPAASAGFTVLGFATGSAGGVAPRTLTVMIKDLAATPIPVATVTHSTASSATHGGGQFIIPVA